MIKLGTISVETKSGKKPPVSESSTIPTFTV